MDIRCWAVGLRPVGLRPYIPYVHTYVHMYYVVRTAGCGTGCGTCYTARAFVSLVCTKWSASMSTHYLSEGLENRVAPAVVLCTLLRTYPLMLMHHLIMLALYCHLSLCWCPCSFCLPYLCTYVRTYVYARIRTYVRNPHCPDGTGMLTHRLVYLCLALRKHTYIRSCYVTDT